MGRKLPILKSCCYCIPLRMGVYISAFWFMITQLLSVVFIFHEMYRKKYEYHDRIICARFYMVNTLQIICVLIYLLLTVTLIIGVNKNKAQYLRHFFLANVVMVVANLVIICVGIIFYGIWTMAYGLLFSAFDSYFLIVVRSTYLSMEEEKEIPRYMRTSCRSNKIINQK